MTAGTNVVNCFFQLSIRYCTSSIRDRLPMMNATCVRLFRNELLCGERVDALAFALDVERTVVVEIDVGVEGSQFEHDFGAVKAPLGSP